MKSAYHSSFNVAANRTFFTLLLVLLWVSHASAQTAYTSHMVPTGKGWSEEHAYASHTVVIGNGISWHGGSIMPGDVHVYYIWYGNWTSGPKLVR